MRLFAALACGVLLPCTLAASPQNAAPTPPAGVATPCGVFALLRAAPPRYEERTIYETIAAHVGFTDGHQEHATFPYPWVFGDERGDPWSKATAYVKDDAYPLRMPPRGADTSSYPPLIRSVLAHMNGSGDGTLPNCTAYAAPTTWPDAAGMDFVDDSAPDSPVEILDPRNYYVGCVAFRNRSTRTLAVVHFILTNVDAAGRSRPAEKIDRFGSFAPGVLIEAPPRGMSWARTSNNMLRNCRWNYPWSPE